MFRWNRRARGRKRLEITTARLTDWSAVNHRRYLIAVLGVVVLSSLLLIGRHHLGVLNVGLIFLLLNFALALVLGSGPATVASVLSFLAFDFFFIPPYRTFAIADSDHVLALFVYLGVAIVTGQLVAQVRAQSEIAHREQRRTSMLFDLNAALVGNVTLDAILATIVERVVHVYGSPQCRILLPAGGTLRVRAQYPDNASREIDRQNLAMATYALEQGAPAGQGIGRHRVRFPHGTRTPVPNLLPRRSLDALYLPIGTSERTIGVLEVVGKPGAGRFSDDDVRLLTSFADQAGLALERARLTDEAARASALLQSDDLKSALLAAVSHDLRTPLATIKTSVTSLLDDSVHWTAGSQAEFLHAIDEETDRLTLMVGNLLDLSRIEGGALRPDREWNDVVDLLADVADRLTKVRNRHELALDIEPDLPLAYLDYVEIAQVLVNIGENAFKYTPPGTTVTLNVRRSGHSIEFAITDNGPGIAPRDVGRLFDKFFRSDATHRVPGSGIGLTISKGIVEAHGGRIWAESRLGEGTTVAFTIPIGDDRSDTGAGTK